MTPADDLPPVRRIPPAVVSAVVLVAVAAGITAAVDELLLARVHAGSDNALRLAAILPYVGVDGLYTLARSLGMCALLFAYASMVLGLLLAGSGGRGRRFAATAARVHRQTGVLTLVLAAGHAAVPFSSVFAPYGGWTTAFVPFAQPVSWGIHAATWESLGILSFYLGLLTGPTYFLLRRSVPAWRVVHRLTVAVYALAVAHALLLGTDFMVAGPPRAVVLAAQVPLVAAATLRVARIPGRRAARRLAGAGGTLAAAALAAFSVLVATGQLAGGMRL